MSWISDNGLIQIPYLNIDFPLKIGDWPQISYMAVSTNPDRGAHLANYGQDSRLAIRKTERCCHEHTHVLIASFSDYAFHLARRSFPADPVFLSFPSLNGAHV